MHATRVSTLLCGTLLILGLGMTDRALANGGPFVLKYPGGDPAAKGIPARIDPSLKPAREERLRVVKELLEVAFAREPYFDDESGLPPLARVSATYTIENPTDEEIEIDFGFPILRGVYIDRLSMIRRPAVYVMLNEKQPVESKIISNSLIYGIIRQRAREVIDAAVEKDSTLAQLVAHVREADADRPAAREELAKHLVEKLEWTKTDAALMVEYASVDFGKCFVRPADRENVNWHVPTDSISRNLGPLAAIGEQKVTQLFAVLAARFDPEAAASYESIFTAWGGDVRERSVDLKTGALRPREISVTPEALAEKKPGQPTFYDPTIYARVDYLDPKASLSDTERASCLAVLKNLPVIFTFAPMNLLHYHVKFPPKQTQTLTIGYQQYAYLDTAEPESYQLAYVVHPASLWEEFGPITLRTRVPKGVPLRASVACEKIAPDDERQTLGSPGMMPGNVDNTDLYEATLDDKTGELFIALGAEEWKATKGK